MMEHTESLYKVLYIDALYASFFELLESNHSDVGWLISKAVLYEKPPS